MKKVVAMLLMFTLVVSMFSSVAVADTSNADSIFVNQKNGTVTIGVSTDFEKIKVIVKKDEMKYIYNMYSSKAVLPMQMGSGIYEIGVYDNIEGKKYRKVNYKKVSVKLDELSVFLQDIQEVAVSGAPATIAKARELTNLEKEVEEHSDMEKLEIVYDYVINNIDYDMEKAKKIGVRYLPDADQILANDKGICYDYASLTAVMLRSLDIPTKLNKGYTTYTKNYHAWNEVYINGKWLIVDTTTDASLLKENLDPAMIKESEDYKVKYEF